MRPTDRSAASSHLKSIRRSTTLSLSAAYGFEIGSALAKKVRPISNPPRYARSGPAHSNRPVFATERDSPTNGNAQGSLSRKAAAMRVTLPECPR